MPRMRSSRLCSEQSRACSAGAPRAIASECVAPSEVGLVCECVFVSAQSALAQQVRGSSPGSSPSQRSLCCSCSSCSTHTTPFHTTTSHPHIASPEPPTSFPLPTTLLLRARAATTLTPLLPAPRPTRNLPPLIDTHEEGATVERQLVQRLRRRLGCVG